MIKLFRCLLLLILGLFVAFKSAQAVVKFDPGATSGKITETTSGWGVTAKKQMDQSVTLQTVISYGKGAMELTKFGYGMYQDPMGTMGNTFSSTLSAVDSVKDTAGGIGGDLTNSALDSVAGVVGETMGGVSGAAGGAMGAVNSKTQDAQKLMALKQQLSSAESAQAAEIAAAQENFNGKIKLADDNIAKLRAMQAQDPSKKDEYESQIASFENQKSTYQNQMGLQESIVKEKGKSEIDSLNKQMADLRNEAAAKAGDAAADKLTSMLGGSDPDAALMNAMIKKNFLTKDGAETSENVMRVRVYRKLVAMQDTIAAFNAAWKIKKTRLDNTNKTEETQEKVSELEGATASLALDTKLKVENINALLEYTKLMVHRMKMNTANELAELHKWKLNNYEKDVSQFNLDDYVFNKKSLGDKLSAAGNFAQGVQKNGLKGTAESMVGDFLDDSVSEQGSSGGQGGGTSVQDELRRARGSSGDVGVDTSGPTDSEAVDVDAELSQARSGASEQGE